MAESRVPIDAPLRIARGDLWRAIERRSASALAAGALEPIATEMIPAHDGGIPFVVRFAHDTAARRRRLASRSDHRNPFLPADPSSSWAPSAIRTCAC
jgi:ATP adenylyltransferase/5',5'''-P-1,P-4-tetraphosphate phosphorylase II